MILVEVVALIRVIKKTGILIDATEEYLVNPD